MSLSFKIFDSLYNPADRRRQPSECKKFSCFSNETLSFQLIAENDGESVWDCSLEIASDLPVRARREELVPAGFLMHPWSDDYVFTKDQHVFYDYLTPLNTGRFCLRGGFRNAYWFTVGGEDLPAGRHKILLTVKDGAGEVLVQKEIAVTVYPQKLPESDLAVTNWMHYDCICNYYGVSPFSEKFWTLTGAFIRSAVEHGINTSYVPMFTPPLDTAVGKERRTIQLIDVKAENGKYSFGFDKFDRFISIAEGCGVKYFEMSHLFTQWGARACPKIIADTPEGEKRIFGWDTPSDSAEYTSFLESFLPSLEAHITALGIKDRTFVHISDEPNEKCIDLYARHKALFRRLIPDLKHIDALSEIAYLDRKLVDIPVAASNAAAPFIASGAEYWAYYCTSQCTSYVSNRLMNMPHARNRVLGVQLYQSGAKGFLQWGFNFYNTYLSHETVNPFLVTDAGGGFQSGDAFIVYPAPDGVYDSPRYEVFREAMQDYRVLMLLEKYIGRPAVIDFLKEEGIEGYSVYPRGAKPLLSLRKKAEALIASASRKADNRSQ